MIWSFNSFYNEIAGTDRRHRSQTPHKTDKGLMRIYLTRRVTASARRLFSHLPYNDKSDNKVRNRSRGQIFFPATRRYAKTQMASVCDSVRETYNQQVKAYDSKKRITAPVIATHIWLATAFPVSSSIITHIPDPLGESSENIKVISGNGNGSVEVWDTW